MIAAVSLLIIGGFMKACRDVSDKFYSTSVFSGLDSQYFNPALSWKNKYSWKNQKITGEKFPLSTTVFVFVTDFGHLTELINILCLIGSGYFNLRLLSSHYSCNWLIAADVILAGIIYSISFEFWKRVLKREKILTLASIK